MHRVLFHVKKVILRLLRAGRKRDYIENGIVADYQDHHYPSEMSVDAMIQTYLMDDSADATDTFMKRFDKEWIRYNRDIVAKVKAYEEGNDHE